jgi:hydrogenase maturation protease
METLLTKKLDKILIIGIGNNTRQDDGLGWCFLDALEKEGFNASNLLYKYQLMVEDAETISNYHHIIFVDACKDNLKNGYSIEPLKPSSKFEFTTHSVPPNQILNLCETVYQKNPKAYIIKIQGYNWEYKISLSKKAKINLENAITHFLKSQIL